ncbi:MAG: hypothetical protein Q9159_001017 [Coniocarpon cinnabarinum]
MTAIAFCRTWRLSQSPARAAQKRLASTSTTPPPLLLKLRRDLKTAMQEKDKNRLNVLRGLIADVTTAAKTSNPINTDMHVLSLLRKRTAAGREAAAEFAKGGRPDLKQNEDAQVSVLEEYAGGVETIGDDEIMTRIGDIVNSASMSQESGQTLNKGTVMKKLLGPGGTLEGKPVEKANVARLVDVALGDPSR